jgi:hypothetical protein
MRDQVPFSSIKSPKKHKIMPLSLTNPIYKEKQQNIHDTQVDRSLRPPMMPPR